MSCPDPDALLAEAEGYGLDSTRRHLEVCEDCRRVVQDLRDFPDIEPLPGQELSEEEERAAWERFRAEIRRLETN